jgi:tRNA threonylcarbamoyl adenosine modification protein YjeE
MSKVITTVRTKTDVDTMACAERFVERVLVSKKQSHLVLLKGDLSVGKTQFVKGLGKGLGISRKIVSPSFTYMRSYEFQKGRIKGKLVHVDAWRIKEKTLFDLLKLPELLVPGNIVAVEWPKAFLTEEDVTRFQRNLTSVCVWEVTITEEAGGDRQITVSEL